MSTKVDNYAAIGWKPQQPFVISGADYMLGPSYDGYIGMPVEIDTSLGTSGVADDSSDQNKRWVKPYASTSSATRCVGVIFKNLFAKGNANERRLGMGGYRRDIALLQFGIVPMLNVGSSAVTQYDRVAPLYNSTDELSGFGDWSAGNEILGYCFQAEIPAGHWGWIFISLEATPAPTGTVDLGDLSSVSITAAANGDILQHNGASWVDVALTIDANTDATVTSLTTGDVLGTSDGTNFANLAYNTEITDSVTSHVHSFAGGNTFTKVLVVANRDDGGLLVPSATAPSSGEYQITDSGTTITTNATDDIAEVLITYMYNAN